MHHFTVETVVALQSVTSFNEHTAQSATFPVTNIAPEIIRT